MAHTKKNIFMTSQVVICNGWQKTLMTDPTCKRRQMKNISTEKDIIVISGIKYRKVLCPDMPDGLMTNNDIPEEIKLLERFRKINIEVD